MNWIWNVVKEQPVFIKVAVSVLPMPTLLMQYLVTSLWETCSSAASSRKPQSVAHYFSATLQVKASTLFLHHRSHEVGIGSVERIV